MGMIDSSFGAFCEGLSSNTKLQVLDLRNNQISHDGASDLAAALRRNTTLRVLGKTLWFKGCVHNGVRLDCFLDLRWNNVGLLGGRSLLSAMESNKTVVKLELAGNNTPNDILKAIGK